MAIVTNIRRVHHKGKVHDLCVENTHTYNVEGLAVHNSAAGSLISYCLGLTDVDPIQYGLLFERFLEEGRPDPPDIDTDFDPRIRDWVKQHIVEIFGSPNVCSIGTYQTYKTRAVILDVTRALGENVAEANAVTKRIEPLRAFEDEGGEEHKVDQMEFDDICEHYPELKVFFDGHPQVRRFAEILRNQIKNMGTHAGGVIISDKDLRDRIPVLYDKPSSPERKVISAWAESGTIQELSSVGLVKYDILGLNNLQVISDCVRMVGETTGEKLRRVDIPIDDRESILLGSKRDLVGIFQFENPVTRPIVDKVGMESLTDVAVITSLIRPGPMDAEIGGEKAPFEYARRKHGGEYQAPEFIRKALAETHGIMVFQEDVMRLSRVLSGFSAAEANKLRKAAGKKIKELMASIRERLITGAKPRIDAGEITQEEVEQIWGQIETFAGYGFCKSVDIKTMVWCNGRQVEAWRVKPQDKVLCFDGAGWVQTTVVANHDHGWLPAFEVVFDGGEKVVCSLRHKFETEKGKMPLWALIAGGGVLCAEDSEQLGVRFLSGDVPNKKDAGTTPSRCVASRRLLSARFVGFRRMCDLEVCHRSHNYALANGILSCNSHAITYGAISTTELWLKYHYPLQFVAALINNTKQGKKKHGSSNVLVDYINYTRRRGIPVLCPDISLSREEFSIDGKSVRFGLRHVKNVATSAKVIEKFQPFSSVEDFYERVKVDPKQEQQEGQEQESETESDQDKSEAEVEEAVEETQGKKSAARRPSRKVVESLIAAGAFDKFGTRNQVLAEYWRVRELKKKKKTVPPEYDDDTWQKAEVEALGLCLSKPILYKEYEELIQKEKWYLVSEVDGSKKRVVVFGQITSVRQHVSKNGNMMHIVELSDGLDSIKFFVFQGGWDVFRDKYREGVIGAVPLNKFDEGDTRFFDDRAPCVVLKR